MIDIEVLSCHNKNEGLDGCGSIYWWFLFQYQLRFSLGWHSEKCISSIPKHMRGQHHYKRHQQHDVGWRATAVIQGEINIVMNVISALDDAETSKFNSLKRPHLRSLAFNEVWALQARFFGYFFRVTKDGPALGYKEVADFSASSSLEV